MEKKTICKAVALGLFFGAVSPAWAIDVGTHTYAEDHKGKSGNVEFYYGRYHERVNTVGASGTVYSDVESEYDRYMVRMNYFIGPRAIFYIEGGMVTDSTANPTDDAPIFGAGFKLKIFSSPYLDFNAFAARTYITTMEDSRIYYANSPFGEVTMTTDHSIAEFNGGLSVSKIIPMGNISCTPYGGLMLIKVNSERDYEMTFHDERNRSEELDGSLEESDEFAAFAGFSFAMNDAFGLRFEGRFSSETSYFAGLSYAF